MFANITPRARALALALWQEQIAAGISDPGETASPDRLDEWLAIRAYPASMLEAAAAGDVAALIFVRDEADLPPFSELGDNP